MKRVIGLLFLFIVAGLLTGCGSVTVPPSNVMKTDLQGFTLLLTPDENQAVLYVVRPSSGAPVVSFDVYIDSQEKSDMIGHNDTKEYIYTVLPPGHHTIYSKAENWAKIEIEAKPNQTVFLEQIPKIGILFARNELKQLDELEGTYHVKHLELGTLDSKE